MQYGIYEEFPTEENLRVLEIVDIPLELVIAANGLDAYNNATNVRDQLNALKLLATFVGCGKSLSLEN